MAPKPETAAPLQMDSDPLGFLVDVRAPTQG